jgi:uncharacterized membrane protein
MSYTPLPLVARFYIYGLQGILTEVVYTALWELVFAKSIKLIGVSSVYAFFIYACSQMFIEQIHPILINTLRMPLPLRGLLYIICTYAWEFSTGYALKQFNACPWDYSTFNWHFLGVITLEYAPLWFFGSILAERIFIPCVTSLHWPKAWPFLTSSSTVRTKAVKKQA